NDLNISASRASDLTALARLHLDVVADRANRHLTQQHGVAWLGVGLFTSNHYIAYGQALRCDDVCDIAIFVLKQSDERSAVRILFDTFNRRGDIPLATLEVDNTVLLLVAAADTTRSDMTLVVTATGLALTFGERLDRLTLEEARLVNKDKAAPRRASRIVILECHRSRLRYR